MTTGSRVQNNIGIGSCEMVDQVSRGTRLRRSAGLCHQGETLVVTENPVLPHATVPLGAHTCYWRRPRSHPLPMPGPLLASNASTQCWSDCSAPLVVASSGCCQPQPPLRAFHLPLLLRSNPVQQPPLAPAASNGPAHTCGWHWSSCTHPLPVPTPLTPTARARATSHTCCWHPVPVPIIPEGFSPSPCF